MIIHTGHISPRMSAYVPFVGYDDRPVSIDEGSREVLQTGYGVFQEIYEYKQDLQT